MRRAAAVKARQRRLKDEAENQEELLADTSVTSTESKTPKSAGKRKGGRSPKGSTGKQKHSEEKSEDTEAESRGMESEDEKNSDLEEKYEVERIVDMKVVRGVKKFRIRWKGYDADSDTWEIQDNLNCPEAMQEFLSLQAVKNDDSVKTSGKKRASKVTEASEGSAVPDQQETLTNGAPKDEDNGESPKDEEEEMTPPKKKKRLSEKPKSVKKQIDTDNVEDDYDADDDDNRNEDDEPGKEVTSEEISNTKKKVKSKTKSKGKEQTAANSESENDMKNDEPDHEEHTTKKQRGKAGRNKSVSKKSEELEGDESEEKTSEEAYEVEKIMEVHHKKNGKKEYLIHWRGYPHSQDTWEPEEHLDCEELIREFEEKVNKAKDLNVREMRTERARTSRYSEEGGAAGKRQSKRGKGKKRTTYFDAE